MDWKPVFEILPSPYQQAMHQFPMIQELEELRLRSGKPAAVVVKGWEQDLLLRGNPVTVSQADLNRIVAGACGQSVYASAEAIAQGFVPLPGGHRLGICGTIADSGSAVTIREYSSVNLRIAKECPGCADEVVAELRRQPGGVLMIGAPGNGKTTLLRDLIRQLSDRLGRRVGVADERREIAAVRNGIPQLNVGKRTDVMSGGKKADSLMRLLRSMNPEYLAMDEISAACDLEALQRAAYCGVRLIATAHAFDREDLQRRPVFWQLMQSQLFTYLVEVKPDRTVLIERME